jgi:hypothetical protein
VHDGRAIEKFSLFRGLLVIASQQTAIMNSAAPAAAQCLRSAPATFLVVLSVLARITSLPPGEGY